MPNHGQKVAFSSLYCAMEGFLFRLTVYVNSFEGGAVCVKALTVWLHEDRK